MKEKIKKKFITATILSFTLGLAPFKPEPHLFGKIRWILGGAVGMQPIDYFDLVLHGTPWVLFLYYLVLYLRLHFFK